jgi:hypothetical protein
MTPQAAYFIFLAREHERAVAAVEPRQSRRSMRDHVRSLTSTFRIARIVRSRPSPARPA